mgnify:CR=1 FL=1
MNSEFNPADWQDDLPEAFCEPEKPKERNPLDVAPTNSRWTSFLEEQIEEITRRIEATGTDITATYADWLRLGFALVEALGEGGRPYFHRLSRFYPDYNAQEADNQYNNCLKARGHGVTPKSFFQLAKENGINVSIRPPKPAKPLPSTDGTDGTDALMETPGPEPMPTFSQELYGHLPDLLEAVVRQANSDEDADVLLLGSIVSFSSCLPKIFGVYGGRQVFPNLFLFVTAPASAGKGRLSLCRRLVQPIHDQLRNTYKAEMDEYRIQKARYEHDKKKDYAAEPPEEPPLRMLIIPANSSATSVYQILSDNGGNALMFETEGDTLANVFASDYGNFSDGFRKAFHHEPISYTRRKDREFVELLRPRLSTVLSGTPRQISALIPDAENGLFSRFIFYYINFKLEWLDVFARIDGSTLDEIFDDIGWSFAHVYQDLEGMPEMEFQFTLDQQHAFNDYYTSLQAELHSLFGDDIIASVRRLGLITFRIAMVLTALRCHDTGELGSTLLCDDEDFASSMAIARVLIKHTIRVYQELSSAELSKPAAEGTKRKEQFLSSLPGTFTTQAFKELATRLHIPEPTAERYIGEWCKKGVLTRIKQGYYERNDKPTENPPKSPQQ